MPSFSPPSITILQPIVRLACQTQPLLTALACLYGLQYSHNNSEPFIALLPKWISLNQPNIQNAHYLRDTPTLIYERQVASLSLTELALLWSSEQKYYHSSGSSSAFQGGLCGYIGYLSHSHYLACYDIFFRHEDDYWVLYGPADSQYSKLYHAIMTQLHAAELPITEILIANVSPKSMPTASPPPSFSLCTPLSAVWQWAQYQQAYTHIQNYLYAGDCYQINLTQPFIGTCDGSLHELISPLQTLSPTPYFSYSHFSAPDARERSEFISASPELFLHFGSQHLVTTSPIKGTRPRGHTVAEDSELKQQLAHSEKERSENMMITDLLRHDLAKHAEIGSVEVTRLFDIESFAQVHHLVSHIRAKRLPHIDTLTYLLDTLPSGSITGAPKHRACQIIDALEIMPRDIYCGNFGFINWDDTGQFNVLIRTLCKRGSQLAMWSGGGITVQSDAAAEYQECLDKIQPLMELINSYGKLH